MLLLFRPSKVRELIYTLLSMSNTATSSQVCTSNESSDYSSSQKPGGSLPNQTSSHERKKLSEIFHEIFFASDSSVTLGNLVDRLEHRGIAISLMLLSLPAALPIPAAGYSTILSIPLFAIGVAIFCGTDRVLLPERVRKFEFNPSKVRRVMKYFISLMKFIERCSKPRFSSLLQTRLAQRVIGAFICLLAGFMFLPIPLTNTLPAGGIFLIAFGLLELDLILVLFGMLFSLFAMAVPIVAALVGVEAIKQAISAIR